MSTEDFDHEYEYELVAPFIVCQSNGGSLDDRAFVCGVHYAELRNRLKVGNPTVLRAFEYPELRQQLELLAMELDYGFTSERHGDDWDSVTFSRSPKGEQ